MFIHRNNVDGYVHRIRTKSRGKQWGVLPQRNVSRKSCNIRVRIFMTSQAIQNTDNAIICPSSSQNPDIIVEMLRCIKDQIHTYSQYYKYICRIVIVSHRRMFMGILIVYCGCYSASTDILCSCNNFKSPYWFVVIFAMYMYIDMDESLALEWYCWA